MVYNFNTAEDLEDCDWPRKLKEIDLESNGQEQSDRAPKTDELESLHLVDHNMIGNLDGKLGNLKELCLCTSKKETVDNEQIWFLRGQKLPKLQRVNMNYDGEVKDMFLMHRALKTVDYLCVSFRNDHIIFMGEALAPALPKLKAHETPRAFTLRINHRVNEFKLSSGDSKSFMDKLVMLCKKLTVKFGDWRLIVHGLSTTESWINYLILKICGKCHLVTEESADLRWNIVMSKFGCKIDGNQDGWIVKCKNCEYK